VGERPDGTPKPFEKGCLPPRAKGKRRARRGAREIVRARLYCTRFDLLVSRAPHPGMGSGEHGPRLAALDWRLVHGPGKEGASLVRSREGLRVGPRRRSSACVWGGERSTNCRSGSAGVRADGAGPDLAALGCLHGSCGAGGVGGARGEGGGRAERVRETGDARARAARLIALAGRVLPRPPARVCRRRPRPRGNTALVCRSHAARGREDAAGAARHGRRGERCATPSDDAPGQPGESFFALARASLRRGRAPGNACARARRTDGEGGSSAAAAARC
jgi:hypothetical protein